jgi:hypothetical protein
MTNKSIQLAKTLLSVINDLEPAGATLRTVALMEGELRPRDYLRSAQRALSREDDVSLIDTVSHLKRAVDCQVKMLLHVFNLDQEDRFRRSLKDKLDFLSRCRFHSGTSLKKLNTLRNKIEHEHLNPSLADPDLYLELVESFVQVCEGVVIFAQHRELNLDLGENIPDERAQSVEELIHQKLDAQSQGRVHPGGVTAYYDYDRPRIVFTGRFYDEDSFEYEATTDNWQDFEFFLKVMYGFYEFIMIGDRTSLVERLISEGASSHSAGK